jgi:hypothetical protein
MRYTTLVAALVGLMACSCADTPPADQPGSVTDYAAMFDGLGEPTQDTPQVVARPLAGDTFTVGDTMEIVFKRLQPLRSCFGITLWEEYSGTIAYTLDGHTFSDPNGFGIDPVVHEQHGDIDVIKWVVTDSVINVEALGPNKVPTRVAGGWLLRVGSNFLDCGGLSSSVAPVVIR